MGGTVVRRIAARSALVLAVAAALLAGSCSNNLTGMLQIWAGLDMLTVPGGTLDLGDVENMGGYLNEKPVHATTISPFEMSRFEVSQSLFMTIMGSNPSWFMPPTYSDEPSRPVDHVSWQQAIEFCNALSQRAGLTPCYTFSADRLTVTWDPAADGFRLPTEAEWEYAARGGTDTGHFMFSGSNIVEEVGWCLMNSTWDPVNLVYITHPVGSLGANELGFYDMSGNVAEWCWDTYAPDYTYTIDWTNPRGPEGTVAKINRGGAYEFVARGGSAGTPVDELRNARRLSALDTDTVLILATQIELGLRVARNP